jgi:Flp pilus assembly protein TadG
MERRTDERGQAMVEFTLIATVLATLLLAVFQFGVAFSDYISVPDARRSLEGARHLVGGGLLGQHLRLQELVHDGQGAERPGHELGRRPAGHRHRDRALLRLHLRTPDRLGNHVALGHDAHREQGLMSRLRRSQRGQTAVEFTLMIPVMLLFVLGIFQVGTTFFNNESIQTAARDGARAGAIHSGDDDADIYAAVTAAVKANVSGLDLTKLTITEDCGTCNQNDLLTVTVSYPWKIGVLAFSQSGTLTTVTKLRME